MKQVTGAKARFDASTLREKEMNIRTPYFHLNNAACQSSLDSTYIMHDNTTIQEQFAYLKSKRYSSFSKKFSVQSWKECSPNEDGTIQSQTKGLLEARRKSTGESDLKDQVADDGELLLTNDNDCSLNLSLSQGRSAANAHCESSNKRASRTKKEQRIWQLRTRVSTSFRRMLKRDDSKYALNREGACHPSDEEECNFQKNSNKNVNSETTTHDSGQGLDVDGSLCSTPSLPDTASFDSKCEAKSSHESPATESRNDTGNTGTVNEVPTTSWTAEKTERIAEDTVHLLFGDLHESQIRHGPSTPGSSLDYEDDLPNQKVRFVSSSAWSIETDDNRCKRKRDRKRVHRARSRTRRKGRRGHHSDFISSSSSLANSDDDTFPGHYDKENPVWRSPHCVVGGTHSSLHSNKVRMQNSCTKPLTRMTKDTAHETCVAEAYPYDECDGSSSRCEPARLKGIPTSASQLKERMENMMRETFSSLPDSKTDRGSTITAPAFTGLLCGTSCKEAQG